MSALIGLQCHLCKATFPGRSRCTSARSASGRSSRSTTTPPSRSRARRSSAGRRISGAIASCCRSPASRSPGSTPASRRSCAATRLAERLGLSELYVKDDSVNHPTLSYKDRVVSVAATRAVELGFNVLACASTGNLANSVAAHAARLGVECCVFIPDNLEAGQAARLRDLPSDDSRHRRQLRRREPALHAGRRSLRLGLRQHQPAVVLRRRRQDDGVRDRRAARLALSEASSCRRWRAARCCRGSCAAFAS